jgi:hypothetical protein
VLSAACIQSDDVLASNDNSAGSRVMLPVRSILIEHKTGIAQSTLSVADIGHSRCWQAPDRRCLSDLIDGCAVPSSRQTGKTACRSINIGAMCWQSSQKVYRMRDHPTTVRHTGRRMTSTACQNPTHTAPGDLSFLGIMLSRMVCWRSLGEQGR